MQILTLKFLRILVLLAFVPPLTFAVLVEIFENGPLARFDNWVRNRIDDLEGRK
mgnify:CR=1 FL=1